MTRMPVGLLGKTHPGLGASRALGIDPNVLGDDAALLVKFEVLVELERARRQQTASPRGHGAVPASNLALTVSVREMIASAYNEQC